MAYVEHTAVATANDVVQRIVSFAETAGWTVERNDDSGANRIATLRKVGVTDYVHVYAISASTIAMRVSIGYDAGQSPAGQPDVSGEALMRLGGVGPYPRLFLFSEENSVWAAVAIGRSGEYRHATFGLLDKVGVYTGGTYVDGTNWGNGNYWASFSGNRLPFQQNTPNFPAGATGRVRVDVPQDGRESFFFTTGATGNGGVFSEFGDDTDGRVSCQVLRADDNAFSGRSVFHPLSLYVGRTGTPTYYSPIGAPRGVRLCSLAKFEPEQEVTIGTEVYKVFPCIGKRSMNSVQGDQPGATGIYGYAIRKTE